MGAEPPRIDALTRQGLRARPARGGLRTGIFDGRPVAGLVATSSVVLVRLDDGAVLLDRPARGGQVFLDVAIEGDAAFALVWADGAVVCDLLLGEAPRIRPEPLWRGTDGIESGALRVVDGRPCALIATEEEEGLLLLGRGEPRKVLTEYIDAVVEPTFLDILAPPAGDPNGSILFGSGAEAPPFVGGGSTTGPGWIAANLRVELGSIENDYSIYEATDVWCGYMGGVPMMAYPSDWSIQVRRLDNGDLVSFRVLREARSDGPRNPRSVSFGAGHLCAVLWGDRVSVIDWDDGSVVDQRWLGSPAGEHREGAVRLLEVGAEAWMVGIDDGVLWFDRVRSRPLLRSSRTQVPRTWRSVGVAPDSRVVVGIDPAGEAQVRYGGFYTSDPFRFPAAGFTVGRGPWAAVGVGPVSPVNIFVGVRRDGSAAFGACQPSEWGPVGDLAKPTIDPVTAFTVGHEPLLGHGSGAVTSRVELWREDGAVLKLIDLDGVVVVLVATKGDEENCVVRVRGHDGRLVAQRHVGQVKSLDAVAIRDDLWIVVSGGDPDSFTTLRLAIKDEPGGSPGQFETGYEQVGVDATSVGLNDREGRPIVGMLVGQLLQVVDVLDGSPIGVAPLDPERWVLVEVPGGPQFLAGDAVLRVAEPSDVAAVRPDPLNHAHMRPGDVRADRLWRRLDTHKDESPRPSGAQMPAEPDDIAGPPDDLRFRDVVLDFVPYSELPYAMLLDKAELGDGAAEAELNRRAREAVERDIRALHDEDGAPEP